MTLWRARTKAAGAWRSAWNDPGRPRRLTAASAFGVLVVVGAAGSYFAVVNGIGALIGDRAAGVEPYPLAAEAPHGSGGGLANSGLGRGTADSVGRAPAAATTTAEPVPGTTWVSPATTDAAPQVEVPRPPQVTVSVVAESPPTECCSAPPVPTPTVPVSSPHSPSTTPSSSPTPSSSSPDGSGSPEPSESPASSAPASSDDIAATDDDETSGTDDGESSSTGDGESSSTGDGATATRHAQQP